MVVPVLVKLMRAASIAICLIVIASFLLFAVNQTSTASGKQQEELGSKPAVTHTAGGAAKHESGVRKTLDEVSEQLTSPVDGLSSSEWADRALRVLFALAVYGFALGFLARALRVRS
jgi:hypothetical protein